MNLGLDIGRQFVKAVLLEKSRGGTKIVNTGIRLVPDQNKTYDPESITKGINGYNFLNSVFPKKGSNKESCSNIQISSPSTNPFILCWIILQNLCMGTRFRLG